MSPSPTNYNLLIRKLDEFTRKYYVNQLIRGVLYTTGTVLLLFLAVSVLESQFYFPPLTRKLLWYGFLGLSALALGGWVLLPLSRYFRLGEIISHERAATIIGRHFSNVEDKLLNVLQLRRQAGAADSALLLASIDQKSAEISPVPFRSAIDLSQNRRYLKYALPPLLLLLLLLVAAPSLIRDSTDRLMRNDETFERPAPFAFAIAGGDRLEVVQYDDYPLTVRVTGDALPNEAFIEVDGYRYRMQKADAGTFTYQFSNVQEDANFRLSATEVTSRDYTLEVLPKPSIAAFSVDLDYPAYLGRRDETLANVGDLTVPAGTRLKWRFDTENTDRIDLRFASERELSELRRDGTDQYSFDRRALRTDRYTLYVSNDRLPLADSVSYGINVVADLSPRISVESFRDSTDEKLLYFLGEASDDHGISRLNFVYRIQREDGREEAPVTLPISGPAGKQTRYEHVWDLANDLPLGPGDELTYYFEVWDNDGVNGAKSARTGVMALKLPTREELAARAEANDTRVKDELKKALEATRDLQEDTERLREKLLQEKELDWKAKKEVEKLAERQQQIQQQIEQARDAFQENLQEQSEQNEQIQQKQEKLQELFEESLDEKMQELMREIQELMEELNKDESIRKMEEMELDDEQTEKELDRMLELFKQLEVEKEMQEAIEKLDELAEREEELAEDTANEEKSPEELQQEQRDIQEEFEQLEEQMEQTKEKNEALEKPLKMEDQQEQREGAKQDMQDAQEKMEQQDNESASEKQQDAAKKMKQMSESMSASMQSMQMEGAQEDMAAIRQLLENIVDLSFDEEETMNELNETTVNTPRYVELVQRQFQINNDFRLVEDSLQALAKRNFQIESFITEKVTEIKGNLSGTIGELEERRTPQAANLQQRAMTGLNDLALMLSESMQQMQQQMAGMMSGDQQCQNPGDGKGKQGAKPSDNPGSDGQRSLGEAMQSMKEGLKQGRGGSSKEFAEMAARQAALRRALEKKQQENQRSGKGKDGQLQELIDEMNQAEEDLVNKRLTEETLLRQQDILSKMLEHENAERQQKMDEKRESQTAQQRRGELPPDLQEYIRQRQSEVEMFKRVTPELKPYFRSLVDEYFRSLRGE